MFFVPKQLNEKYSTVFGRIVEELNAAIESAESGRTRSTGKAPRWYAGIPQLFLRKPRRNGQGHLVKAIASPCLYHGGQYAQLLDWWMQDFACAALKRKPQQPSTAARRQKQANEMVYRGYVAKATRLNEGTARRLPTRRPRRR